MKRPVLLVVLASSLAAWPSPARSAAPVPAPAPADPAPAPPPLPPAPPPSSPGLDVDPAAPASHPVAPDAATVEALRKAGWKTATDGALARLEGPDKGYIPLEYLTKGKLAWRDGKLAFDRGDAVDEKLLPRMLSGLADFASAARTSPRDAGRQIAAWGLPPVFDGRRLVEADGTATYYGQMLRWIYAEKPEALARASAQRLGQAFPLLKHAYSQAFYEQSPDVAKADLERAKLILFMNVRPGESPVGLKPYEDLGAQIAGLKQRISADIVDARRQGDEARRKDSEAALATLNQLERERYRDYSRLPAVPPPGKTSVDRALGAKAPEKDAPYAPLASGLPGLLRALDRINGKPLSSDQQENLIKSFPMGELVWRMGAQDLWRQGLTGKGVKVAIVDLGIAHHPEIDGVVDSRTNFTAGRGAALNGEHATHVAGIIHALAPDARINGYTVFNPDSPKEMREDLTPLLRQAIDKAVADGNRIVSLSLHDAVGVPDEISRQVEKYSERGVIFVVAAGNLHDSGINAPSVASNALTVGALDASGRMADFSSYGSDFDPRRLEYVVKSVFMTPGTNVYSTLPAGPMSRAGDPPQYGLMSGTSMATPALAGVTALLVQAAGTANPVTLSARIRDALAQGSTPMAVDGLPPNVPLDQDFLVVHPLAALDALRRGSAPAVAGSR